MELQPELLWHFLCSYRNLNGDSMSCIPLTDCVEPDLITHSAF